MARQTQFLPKRNFTAGELSPLMYGRFENGRYINGCKTLLNMLVKPQGPALRRSGTKFVYNVTDLLDVGFTAAKSSQLYTNPEDPTTWTAIGGATQTDSGENPLDLFNKVAIESGGTVTDQHHAGTFSVSDSEVIACEVYMLKGSSGKAMIRLWNGTSAAEVKGNYGALAVTDETAATISNLVETDLGWALRVRLEFTMIGAAASVYIGVGPNSATIGEDLYVLGQFANRTAHASYVERTTGAIAGKNRPRLIPFIVDENIAYDLLMFENEYGTVSMAFVYNGGLLADTEISTIPLIFDLQGTFDITAFDYSQDENILYIAQATRQPTELIRTATQRWAFQDISFTDPPSDWSVGNGYPRRVGQFEQRIVYAGNGSRPQTLWFSKSGDFYDFGVNSPVLDSDALTFTLNSGNQNKIRWIASRGPLMIGTLGEEWTLQGAGSAPLTPTNPDADSQDTRGSEQLKPIRVGPVVLFLERLGRVVNQFVYDFNIQGWAATDLSVLAPHLTEENTIVDWAYQQTPNSIVWCIRDDGIILGLTYQREHNVVGWHRHTTDGKFLSISTIPGDTEDEVWTIVERAIDGTDRWYLEKFESEFISGDIKDSTFLDSHLIYDSTPATVITGFDHLEGETVSVLADGAVHPDVTVSSGQITLEIAASKVVVGKSYVSDLVPTVPDSGSESDTGFSRNFSIKNLYVQLYKSIEMKITRIDNDEGTEQEEEVPFREPSSPTGSPQPVFSGVKRISMPEGWGRSVDVRIRQEKPLPLTVIGVVDEIEVTN